MQKAAESDATVVMLLPARTDTAWFHDYIYGKAEIRFIRGRLKFVGSKNSAPFPSMVCIFRKEDNNMDNKNGMTQEREAAILEGAITHFGAEAQIIKAIEELGELAVELARDLNGLGRTEAIREEMADAFIMLNQLELIFGDVTEIEIAKLERLERMIHGGHVPL